MIDSAEEFVKLRTSGNRDDYLRAAREESSLEIWLEIIEKFPEMREWVALNKTIPVQIIRELVQFSDASTKIALAMKRSLPEDVFQKLARDSDDSVRFQVAKNKKTSVGLLETLSRDSEDFVSKAAADSLKERSK